MCLSDSSHRQAPAGASGAYVAASFGIGFVAGLRSFTAPAAVSWAAYLGWIDLQGSALGFMGSTAAVVILSVMALAEYVADKLPRTPNRTKPGPLIARVLMGALTGAALGIAASHSWVAGAALGGTGALIGAFAGYYIRKRLVSALRVRDIMVAVPEDLVAIGLAYAMVA